MPRIGAAPAEPGRLPPETADILRRLRRSSEERRETLRRMTGGAYRGSYAEDTIIREVIIAYAEGQGARPHDCLDACLRWSSRSTVFRFIDRLIAAGVVLRRPDGTLWPSQPLVALYNAQLQGLRGSSASISKRNLSVSN